MKRKVAWSLVMFVVLVGGLLSHTRSASSSSANQLLVVPPAVTASSSFLPPFVTTFDVDRSTMRPVLPPVQLPLTIELTRGDHCSQH